MPRKDICDELIRAYFHHIHPIMPVIDATTLPHLYPSGDGQPYNLILLWSIFYAAANVKPASSEWNCNLANADIASAGRYLEIRGLCIQERDEGTYVLSCKGMQASI